MNNKIEQFWDDFQAAHQMEAIEYSEAYQFGADTDELIDELADLVVQGKKKATTSGLIFYELEKEALPKPGEYSIILNSKNEPVAVVQIQSVDIAPMNEVSEEFALAEGEGDYDYWWKVHEDFLTKDLAEYDMEFSPDMLVVCERFEKVYP